MSPGFKLPKTQPLGNSKEGQKLFIAVPSAENYDPLMILGRTILSLIFIFVVSSTANHVPKFKVLVLDALDGRPQAAMNISFLCGEIPHETNLRVTTDENGVAEVPYSCKSGSKIEVVAVGNIRKEGCGGGIMATIEDITSTGVVSKPDSAGSIWCPTKVSARLKPVPGQVTLFVKKPTWWQSHIAG